MSNSVSSSFKFPLLSTVRGVAIQRADDHPERNSSFAIISDKEVGIFTLDGLNQFKLPKGGYLVDFLLTRNILASVEESSPKMVVMSRMSDSTVISSVTFDSRVLEIRLTSKYLITILKRKIMLHHVDMYGSLSKHKEIDTPHNKAGLVGICTLPGSMALIYPGAKKSVIYMANIESEEPSPGVEISIAFHSIGAIALSNDGNTTAVVANADGSVLELLECKEQRSVACLDGLKVSGESKKDKKKKKGKKHKKDKKSDDDHTPILSSLTFNHSATFIVLMSHLGHILVYKTSEFYTYKEPEPVGFWSSLAGSLLCMAPTPPPKAYFASSNFIATKGGGVSAFFSLNGTELRVVSSTGLLYHMEYEAGVCAPIAELNLLER